MTVTKTNIRYFLLIASIFLLFSTKGFTQVETENPSSDFILKGNHFAPGSPWLIVGAGWGNNFAEKTFEPNFMVDFHYQLEKKKHCFGIGYLTSRNQFLTHDNSGIFIPNKNVRHSTSSLHALYGFRYENMRHNLGVFTGPGYHWGYRHNYTDSVGQDWHSRYNEIGLFIKVDYSFKIFYDIGTGLSAWASLNSSYQAIGLSLHLYLSMAFKRKL